MKTASHYDSSNLLDRATRAQPFFRFDGATVAHNLALNLAKATANFDKAIAFYQNTLGLFARWSQQIIENPNTLPFGIRRLPSVGGDPNILTTMDTLDLRRTKPSHSTRPHPRVPDLNLQVDNYWMESLDYRYHRISINKHGQR